MTILPGAPPPPSRCWTLLAPGGAVDVEVTAADTDVLDSVLPAVAAALGLPSAEVWSGSSRVPGNRTLTDPALAHGAVLGLGRPAPRHGGDGRSGALELHVVGGPAAGTTLSLDRGGHVVGRAGAADVRLADPDVSRRHVLLEVGAGEITVADLGSTNGTVLDGQPLGVDPRPWPAGRVLRLGASAVRTTGPGGVPAVAEPASGGRVRVRPLSRLEPLRGEVEVPLPGAPLPPRGRRLAWVAVALPAIGGVTFAWVLGSPHFLFFALLSPVVAVGTWLSDRWSGRRSGRRAAAAHAADLEEAQDRLQTAVAADVRAAEAASPDLAALITAARRRSGVLWQRRRQDTDALAVRIGTGSGDSRVVAVHPGGDRAAEPVEHLPVVVELTSTGGLAVVGPRGQALGVLAGVLAQLAVLHPPGEVDLVLLTTADRLPEWAWLRWLPHLVPSSVHVGAPGGPDTVPTWLSGLVARRQATGGPRSGSPGWVAVVADGPVGSVQAAALRRARESGVVVLATGPTAARLPLPVDAVVELTGETGSSGTLRRAGAADRTGVVVDRLPARVAAALARDLAPLTPALTGTPIPRQVRLLDLPVAGAHVAPDGSVSGAWPRSRDSLVTTLGSTAAGTVTVDLCRSGPHALVAGTTGSGKSELLQTLIAGLALAHPPDRCSFLLVDYKGGAAFGEAAQLPHTVGLVTDLDGATTARALRSLTAELTRRETLLAEHGVADVALLPDAVELSRLVIVVDEFAGLAEELPDFVAGLVGVAQRGRSLGVHLVLATQRPAGVVSPEIRANCTLRICLRTTDEADSRDVLGSPHAALLPVDTPGRAYLRAGAAPPVLFQAARVAGTAPAGRSDRPRVRPWQWPLPPDTPEVEAAPGGSDLAGLCRALVARAEEERTPRPHRPWCPVLPDAVRVEDLTIDHPEAAPADPRRERLRLGLVDRPDAQAQEPLELDLRRGGGWLVVGGPRSGRTTVLRTVLAEAATGLSPADVHVHVLDHGGGALAAAAAALPHTGTSVGAGDPLRTVRLVDRLGQEVAARRADPVAGRGPRLLLLVDGWESVGAQLDDADPGRGSGALLRLVRNGAAAGLTCLLTADRAVPGGRVADAVDVRLVLPLGDRADYAAAGLPPRVVPSHRPPGRALMGEAAVECQIALPRPLPPATARTGAGPRPLRIPELPADPALPLPDAAVAGAGLRLPVGPGGDEGTVLEVDLVRTGGLLVAGVPGSGRRAALAAFTRHLAAAGARVLRILRTSASPPDAGVQPHGWVSAADVGGWRAWLDASTGAPGVLVVDDHGALAESPVLTAIAAADDALDRLVLLVGGTAGELAAVYRGPVMALRRRRSGLLLCPAPGDADLLGVRLPRTPVPQRPGSGWLVTAGAAQRVQVARRRTAAGDGRHAQTAGAARWPPPRSSDQSSSSTVPISCVAYQASS